MFDPRYLILVAATIATASARYTPRSLELSEMINNTVCAIKVVIDENVDRIPQKIKMMECADNTELWCKMNNIASDDCCHRKHGMECVEITDKVKVYDKKHKRTYQQDVSVGCACMIGRITTAPELRGS